MIKKSILPIIEILFVPMSKEYSDMSMKVTTILKQINCFIGHINNLLKILLVFLKKLIELMLEFLKSPSA